MRRQGLFKMRQLVYPSANFTVIQTLPGSNVTSVFSIAPTDKLLLSAKLGNVIPTVRGRSRSNCLLQRKRIRDIRRSASQINASEKGK